MLCDYRGHCAQLHHQVVILVLQGRYERCIPVGVQKCGSQVKSRRLEIAKMWLARWLPEEKATHMGVKKGMHDDVYQEGNFPLMTE